MIRKRLKKWWNYHKTRFQLRRGRRFADSTRVSDHFIKQYNLGSQIKGICAAVVRDFEEKYEVKVQHIYQISKTSEDFLENTTTIKVTMWKK